MFAWAYTVTPLIQAYDAKATFFITGNNLGKGMVNDPDYPWPSLLQVRLLPFPANLGRVARTARRELTPC